MAKALVPTVNQELMDRITLHDMRLQRLSNGTARRVRELMWKTQEDILDQLQGRLARAAKKGFDTGPVTTKRLRDLSAAYRRMAEGLMPETRALIAADAVEGAIDEAAFQGNLFAKTLPVEVEFLLPADAILRNAALKTPFDGRVLSEWTQKLGRDTLGKFNQQVKLGLLEGETVEQIGRRLRGTRRNGFRDGVQGWQRYEAQTLARTATANARAVARDETYQENSDLIKAVRWSATLDTRTCLRCAALDGRQWRLTETHPQVPLHWNCRCGLLPITKSFAELGIDAAETPVGLRYSLTGDVPADQTYGTWIKKQTASVQREALGPRRYELLKDGGSVGEFVNQRNRVLTLKEMKARESR